MVIMVNWPFWIDPDSQPIQYECTVCHRRFNIAPESEAGEQSRDMEKLRRLLKIGQGVFDPVCWLRYPLHKLLGRVMMTRTLPVPAICEECRKHVKPGA